jgi:hypothetical protein
VSVGVCVYALKRKGARGMNNGIKTIAPNYLLSSAQQRRLRRLLFLLLSTGCTKAIAGG